MTFPKAKSCAERCVISGACRSAFMSVCALGMLQRPRKLHICSSLLIDLRDGLLIIPNAIEPHIALSNGPECYN